MPRRNSAQAQKSVQDWCWNFTSASRHIIGLNGSWFSMVHVDHLGLGLLSVYVLLCLFRSQGWVKKKKKDPTNNTLVTFSFSMLVFQIFRLLVGVKRTPQIHIYMVSVMHVFSCAILNATFKWKICVLLRNFTYQLELNMQDKHQALMCSILGMYQILKYQRHATLEKLIMVKLHPLDHQRADYWLSVYNSGWV